MGKTDVRYCASSFLMYRIIVDRERWFADDMKPEWIDFPSPRRPIHTSDELLDALRSRVASATAGKKVGIALSGGIDSAILLQLMPDDAIAYTFKCVVPGVETTDESPRAAQYLEYVGKPGIEHKVVPIYWEDMLELSEPLMLRKGAPIHSIEVQICKAAMQAKADGCDIFVFGETADCIYGGHSNLLARDWPFGDFVDRWSFVQPYKVLRDFELDLGPYREYEVDGYIDVLPFLSFFESEASLNSYLNACGLAGMTLEAPYAHTVMADPLDLERVRSGQNKYLVREVFNKLYPGFTVPPKTPMPRPMDQWLGNWEGPVRPEFWPHCIDGMSGDQKWLIFALERFLDLVDSGARFDGRIRTLA